MLTATKLADFLHANELGHMMIPFESFSYPFFDLNYTAEHGALVRSVLAAEDPSPSGLKSLYVHIPFCDTICSFCPFVKSVGTPERVAAYLDALEIEMRMVGDTRRLAGWTLDTVYVGGGTPSILNEGQLIRLFGMIRKHFTLSSTAEVSFEYEAKSVDDNKMRVLKELGVTRASFGVQSFDPKTREMVNITASLEQVHAAIDSSTKYFSNTNLDMMVGFPGQTTDDALQDMALAATSGIGSVSVYPVDYVMTLPAWQARIRSGELAKPASLSGRSDMFHAARGELKNHMFEQNMYCFGREDSPATKYMFSVLYGGYRDECVGVGTGAYSFLKGLAYYNDSHERNYVKTLLAGDSPVAHSSPGHAYEKGIVFFPKRMSYDLRDLDDVSLRGVYDERIQQVSERGLVSVADDVMRLTPRGELMYSELMVHFFSDAQKRLYDRLCGRLRSDVGIFDDTDWTDGEKRVRSMGALNAMTAASTNRVSTRSVLQ